MTQDRDSAKLFTRRRVLVRLLLGLVLLAAVFFLAVRSDMAAAQRMLETTADYIKEQCNRYARIELASETKSLMRIVESGKQVAHDLVENNGFQTAEALEGYAKSSYVSGILLLDRQGNILSQYHAEETPALVLEALDSPALLDTINYPEKRYVVRLYCADGGEIDLAATGRQDAEGIVVSHYQTPVEYIHSFNLSVSSLLSGYSMEKNGIIVVSSGETIVASNEESLVGKNTNTLPILRKIKASGTGNKMIHASQEGESISQYFGLMKRGRDFYVYSYLPERSVFANTPRLLLYAVILYIGVVAAISTARWKTAQRYREKEIEAQQAYAHQLQVTNEQLSVAVDQADRANAAKTSFLSRMSYDIRTPLNGIIGLLEIDAAHPEDTELVNANRDKMRVAADHLLSLINDILQMSKLESGEITLAHEPINLNQLSRDILTIIGQKAAESGITMEYDTTSDPVAVPWVYGSPLHLRQIFLNIYTNCIKYNKVGGKVCSKVVCLGMAENTVTYRWIITDTGIGMSQEFLERIFDPFSQERTDARSVYHGTGLGMAIVKGLVEQMNGTIEISSEEGVGSTFVITLPFEVMENTGPVLQPKEGNEATIHGLRLLLAEDNELNAEIAQMLLEDEGAIVTIVADGRQAVEEFQNNPPGTFDAILMDVMMPVMDGLTATREIRALPRPDAKTIPIIAMTANAFAEDAQKCLEAGMTAHLAKPLEMKKAVAIMARCCRPKE